MESTYIVLAVLIVGSLLHWSELTRPIGGVIMIAAGVIAVVVGISHMDFVLAAMGGLVVAAYIVLMARHFRIDLGRDLHSGAAS